MKGKVQKDIASILWLIVLLAIVASRPMALCAQKVKTFTDFSVQQEQDESGEATLIPTVPYLTNNTRYKVISSIYSDVLYNVSEGAFCLVDNGNLTVWTVDGEYLFGPEWKVFGSSGNNNMLFDNGALIAKSIKKNNLGKEFYSILYKNGSVKDLDPSWEPQSGFIDGLAAVVKKQGYRELGSFFINTQGEQMASPSNLVFGYGIESKPRKLKCGLRAFQVRGHKWGFMDENCKVVIQPQWDKVRDFSEDYAWTFTRPANGGDYTATLIDKTGKVVRTVSVPSTELDLSETYVIGDVCEGKYYVYSGDSDPKTTYYDLKGNVLAESYGGTSFYDGHALVRGVNDYNERILTVDDNFNITDSYPTYSSEGHAIHAEELWASNPFETFGLHTIHSGTTVIDSRGRLVLKELAYPWPYGHIRGFSQPSKDGYIVAKNISIDDKQYIALINYTGEIAWLFSQECFTVDDLKGFLKSDDFDKNKVVVECGPTRQQPKGPKTRTSRDYKVKIVCIPQEGGTAEVSGSTPIKYGDRVSIKPSPNSGWVATSIKVEDVERGLEKFSVTDDVTATVTFQKSPVIEKVENTNIYQGNIKMKISGNQTFEVPLYAQMSKNKDIASPFGQNTYGYLAVMLDPTKRYTSNTLSVNVFYPPMKIVGIQREGGKQYLVADAGSAMYHNLRVTTDDSKANLWFTLMLMMDGFESGSVVPRRYRIEMTQVNDNTGECTLGNLQVFSPIKGWVKGQDKSIVVHTASKYPMLSGGAHDLGLPSDFFSGCVLKIAQSRDDVRWFPPLEWARSQKDYDKKVETLKQTYLNFMTDCERLFGN